MNSRDAKQLWLATGLRCPASNAVFTYCSGEDAMDGQEDRPPRTVADLRRIRLLLEAVPDLKSCLPRVANLSREWAELVSFWDDICMMHDLEDPHWRKALSAAPETRKMLDMMNGANTHASTGTDYED